MRSPFHDDSSDGSADETGWFPGAGQTPGSPVGQQLPACSTARPRMRARGLWRLARRPGRRRQGWLTRAGR